VEGLEATVQSLWEAEEGRWLTCLVTCVPGMSERERQVMKRLKEVVDKQRDEIRAKDRELGLKNEDVEAVSVTGACPPALPGASAAGGVTWSLPHREAEAPPAFAQPLCPGRAYLAGSPLYRTHPVPACLN
jgi:hypothetical protein